MSRRTAVITGTVLVAGALAGCSVAEPEGDLPAVSSPSEPAPSASSTSAQSGAVTTPARPESSGWKLFWSDEFDRSNLDRSRWQAYHSTYGNEGGGQLQCHTPRNVTQAGGSLTITAKREPVTCPGDIKRDYSSGFVGSREAGRFYPLFGRYEARVRVPHGQGIGAAFWLRRVGGASHAEVDIMEVFHAQGPGNVTQTVHAPKASGTRLAKATTYVEQPVKGTGGWHTYAVEIEPVHPGDASAVRFRFFVDGRRVDFTHDGKTSQEFVDSEAYLWTKGIDQDAAWDIALSSPVGGMWWGSPTESLGYLTAGLPSDARNPDKCSLTFSTPDAGPDSCPTSADDDGTDDIWFADFPAGFEVDWVRVYTR